MPYPYLPNAMFALEVGSSSRAQQWWAVLEGESVGAEGADGVGDGSLEVLDRGGGELGVVLVAYGS